jgi:diadenosine tetraphosphate (Ap4A) HIT family hydrolase
MFELLELWDINLHKIHKDVSLLLRDGLVWWNTEKSVNHLHFHLIPDCPIWAESLSDSSRKFYEDDEYIVLAQKIKEKFIKQ